jgi:predicted nucleic acid-binding protein
MKQVVVDSSLVIKWLVNEPDSDAANTLYRIWDGNDIDRIMPRWALTELSNALLQRVMKNEFSIAYAVDILTELPRFVSMLDTTANHSKRALVVAYQLGLRAVYDAHFLVLSEELGCELWTADQRFWRTAHGEFPFVNWLGNVVDPA